MKLLLSILMIGLFGFSSINASEDVPTKLEVAKLYVATFNRAPDSAGLDWWTNSSGFKLSQIAQSFFDQTETKALYPDGTSNRDFVRSVYLNLFNREPDTLGWDYWENELNIGSFSKNSFIQAVINGAQNTDASSDMDILSNKSTVGLHFANQGLEDPTEAKNIMAGVTADVATVNAARDTIDLTGTRLVSAPSGKIVDPYIEGAILCEDVNANGTCDDGEKTSSPSTADGDFGFEDTLTPGTNIIIKQQGSHLGETYDLEIAAVVAEDGTVNTVSPLTTFETKEATPEQIAAIINSAAQNAGLSGWSDITAADVLADPLGGGLMSKPAVSITEADLRKILVNMSVYGLMKVMKGSTALQELSGNELYVSGTTSGGAVNRIATFMLQNLSQILNTSLLNQISTMVTQSRSAAAGLVAMIPDAPEMDFDTIIAGVTAGEIINTAVLFMDDFSTKGYTTCNATDGDASTKVTAALAAVQTQVDLLSSKIIDTGLQMYAIEHGAQLAPAADYLSYMGQPTLEQGYNDYVAGYSTYRFNDSGVLTAQ